MKHTFCLLLVFVFLVDQVFGDYGHGGHTQVHSVPSSGKGGKWRIRAKGKGLQNLISHHSGGGGHDEGHGGGHHTQIVYVPVPSYDHGYDHGGYSHGGYSHEHEMSIIPLYGHGGHDDYGGYGGYGHDDYGYGGYM